MKRVTAIVAASLVVAFTVFGCAHNLPSEGWVTLIDGNTGLDNFNRLGGANWHATDGAIQADKSTTQGSSVLVSKRTFKDFEVYAKGSQITVKLNGVITVHVQDSRYSSGAIGLQQNAGLIKWRKVLVRDL